MWLEMGLVQTAWVMLEAFEAEWTHGTEAECAIGVVPSQNNPNLSVISTLPYLN